MLSPCVVNGCYIYIHALRANSDQVSYSRNGFALLARGRRHQRSGRTEQDVVQPPVIQAVEQVRAKHARRAAAARPSRVDVLRLNVEYQHAAVAMNARDVDAVLLQQLRQQL